VERTVLWPADGIVPEFWQYRISSENPTQAAPAPAAKHPQWSRVIDWAETGRCQPIDFAAPLTGQPF